MTTKASNASSKFRQYYQLTKPGVLYGNVITGVAGFLFGCAYFHTFNLVLFVATIFGMTLIIGAACALNNVFDRDIDSVMERTKNRGVASGAVSVSGATWFACALLIAGVVLLAVLVNWLVTAIGVIGFITYVWLYGAFSKRRSIHGTVVGSISGAFPILAGYCAVSGRIDVAAVIVFLILFFWQFPEFYSIAIYRQKEYAKAKVPILSVVKGIRVTKVQIFVYTILFVISTLLLTIFGYTGWVYFAGMLGLGIWWLWLGWQAFLTKDDAASDAWARKMFHASLIVLLAFSALLPLGPLLP